MPLGRNRRPCSPRRGRCSPRRSRRHLRRRLRLNPPARDRPIAEGPPAYVLLEDGAWFPGTAPIPFEATYAEVVFTTNLSGYQEVFTDPSYLGQIVVMTAPMIGNYGINPEDVESDRRARGAAAYPSRRGPADRAGRGAHAGAGHPLRPRSPHRRLLRAGPQRAFQRRHHALRPHLQAGQPPAAIPEIGRAHV